MKWNNLQPTRQTLGEKAYESIREAIISLEFEPGQMIYENELATSLGVSRTPVREAFRMLLSEELIEILPQKGAKVALISETKVEETRFVRESLESAAFRIAANQWTGGTEPYASIAREIDVLLKQQAEAAGRNDAGAFLQLDESFHRKLLALSGNQTLLTVVNQMRGHLNRLRYLSLRQLNNMEDLTVQHRNIWAAVQANDERRTEELLRRHVSQLPGDMAALKGRFGSYFLP
ncbi:GntR family transcriptional regulator [Paenibacillus piri]|uniref:GntR family transcriptional regulator n=1 Tax=Paenibacillus piri TaxID=2547395 RepID=A0A4R5KLR1_9BACL|nr:GntR family transcriptional regulator [Paenibacillus piri]TDF95778.1 GntR family transcriptional regulator [Paenibacillus piri]